MTYALATYVSMKKITARVLQGSHNIVYEAKIIQQV